MPQATTMTIPGSYDQLHRRSMLQAASMAGLSSVRLVDRSLAAVQSLLVDVDEDSPDALTSLEIAKDENILFVGLTGQASEVAVIRRDASRLHQLATEGHWHTGTLPWQQRLVDLTAEAFMKEHGFDPRTSARVASDLQMACERAMNSMLLASTVVINIESSHGTKSVSINRRHWLQACEDLAAGLRKSVKKACRDALVSLEDIDRCVTMGSLMRISTIRKAVLRGLRQEAKVQSVDRSDAARGAAACLASELPGRRDSAMPPRAITGQSIGIVVNDSKGRRRILPIIPKGTSLPARTNRRLTVGNERESMTLSLVESSGVKGDDWQSLGRYDFEVGDSTNRTRMIGFEVNVNGLLSVRAQAPGTLGSTKLNSLPEPTLPEESMEDWITWLDGFR
jgi:molecular chaperone DnaK (HSP70)